MINQADYPVLDLLIIVIYSSNKNLHIKFSAHDASLQLPSSGTLKIERLTIRII